MASCYVPSVVSSNAATPMASLASPPYPPSKTLAIPKGFIGLRAGRTFSTRSPRLASAPRSSSRGFTVKASSEVLFLDFFSLHAFWWSRSIRVRSKWCFFLQNDLPLVGNKAPHFEAEAVFDQEFINVCTCWLFFMYSLVCEVTVVWCWLLYCFFEKASFVICTRFGHD